MMVKMRMVKDTQRLKSLTQQRRKLDGKDRDRVRERSSKEE
jgi:hypothetical protein